MLLPRCSDHGNHYAPIGCHWLPLPKMHDGCGRPSYPWAPRRIGLRGPCTSVGCALYVDNFGMAGVMITPKSCRPRHRTMVSRSAPCVCDRGSAEQHQSTIDIRHRDVKTYGYERPAVAGFVI